MRVVTLMLGQIELGLRVGALSAAALFLLTAAGEPPKPVRVQTVCLSPDRMALSASGTVQARTQADLAFRVGGKIISRPVEIGDHVRAGQVLAQLDPADLQYSQEVSEAALQAAQAELANARIDLKRYQLLGRTSPAYLPSEYDRRESAERSAEARTTEAMRQVALAENQRAYGALIADADGIVTALTMQVGQVVSSGQTVATLAHTAEIEVVADVPENRLSEVRAAGIVSISLWALPNTVLRGKVREIGALADSASRTFAVKVTLLDAVPAPVALGMTATVRFDAPSTEFAVLPASALTDRDGKPAVWVFDARTGHAALRQVAVAGYGQDSSVFISNGIAAGEQVVTAGVQQIEPGMTLTAWAGAAR